MTRPWGVAQRSQRMRRFSTEQRALAAARVVILKAPTVRLRIYKRFTHVYSMGWRDGQLVQVRHGKYGTAAATFAEGKLAVINSVAQHAIYQGMQKLFPSNAEDEE